MRPARRSRRLGVGPLAYLTLAPSPLLAQGTPDIPPPFGERSLVQALCEAAGYQCTARDETFLAEALGSVAFALLSYVGVIFTGLIVYGGVRWMLARGNESEVERARGIIRGAIIGLIVTLASFSIWLAIAYFL